VQLLGAGLQRRGHLVKRPCEGGHLALAALGDLRVELAGAQRASARCHRAHRGEDAPDDVEGDDDHEDEHQNEAQHGDPDHHLLGLLHILALTVGPLGGA